MRKHIILILSLLAFTLILRAQSPLQMEEYELNVLLHSWTQTQNAAGLGLSTIKAEGITELGYNQNAGDYHRAQEGNARNGIDFYSERFDQIGKNLVSWGSFNFKMDREKNRKWSDVMNTYNNNPYIFGSNVAGDYDRQLFDFHAKVGTRLPGKFNFGLGIDYKVADFSRLRDPRSRIFFADYAAIPGITFKLNEKNVIGLNLSVRYQKEQLPNITTVQDDPNLKYYSFFGMENADGIIAGYNSFERQFVSNFYGFDVQYAYKNDRIKFLLNAGTFIQNQDIFENLKQSPGSFHSINFKGNAVLNILLNRLLLNTSLVGNLKKGAADENLQELITVRDTATGIASQQWVTLHTYKNRFINNTSDAQFDLNIRNINTEKNDFSWIAGVNAGIMSFQNRYNLPLSEMNIHRGNAGIYGHYRILNMKNHRITLDAAINYEFGFDNLLTLGENSLVLPTQGASTFVEGTYEVATKVILPDFNFYNSSATKYNLETKYSFPLHFKKLNMIGYTKVFYEQTRSTSIGNWTSTGVSIGIIP